MSIVKFERSYPCHPDVWAFKSKYFTYEIPDHIHQRDGFDPDKFYDDLAIFNQSEKSLTYYTCDDSITIQIKDGYFTYMKDSELGNRLMFTIKYNNANKEAVDTYIDYIANIECIN